MGISAKNTPFSQQIKAMEKVYEKVFASIGLSENQLKAQSYTELKDSLETINDAIRNPSSFGLVSFRFDAGAGLILASASSQAHIQVGVLPLLLARKRYIIQRLRAEKATREIYTLREELNVETDQVQKETLNKRIQHLEQEASSWREKAKEVPKIDLAKQLELEAQKVSIETERFERRSRVWQNFLEKESVATIIGAFLVLLITIAFVISGFRDTYELPQVVTNSYFVILGYFFGQGLGKGETSNPGGENSSTNLSSAD